MVPIFPYFVFSWMNSLVSILCHARWADVHISVFFSRKIQLLNVHTVSDCPYIVFSSNESTNLKFRPQQIVKFQCFFATIFIIWKFKPSHIAKYLNTLIFYFCKFLFWVISEICNNLLESPHLLFNEFHAEKQIINGMVHKMNFEKNIFFRII